MKLSRLLKQIFPGSSTKPKYFLALILSQELVKVSLYEELSSKISLLGKGETELSGFIDQVSIEELLEASDKAISTCEESLPKDIEPSETIFGILDSWQKGGKINKEHLVKLRRLKEDLGLTPIGFVVITEVVTYFLAQKEGAPINGILVEFGKRILTVSLIRASRVAENKTVERTNESTPILIEKVLKGFTNFEVLPSRIILFDETLDLEAVKQECISFSWTKNLPFLHVPRIEVLSKGTTDQAVVAGVANEMGLTLETESKEEIRQVQEDTFTEGKIDSETELTFGFAQDEDRGLTSPIKEEIHQDHTEVSPEARIKLAHFLQMFMAKLKELIPSISLKRPTFRKLFLAPLVIVLALMLYTAFYIFFSKARIEIIVVPKHTELNEQVLIDPTLEQESMTSGKLKGEMISASLEGNKTGEATGKKAVGDKAKGEVKIGNRTETAKTFPKGTILVGPNNLRFALLETTTIASPAPGSFDIPSVNASLEAAAIGEESNLPSGSNFSFADYPTASYFAKSETSFTGGSKKELLVVTRKNQDDLLAALIEALRQQALKELNSRTDDLRVLDIVSEKITDKTFDKKIDEEAKSFSVKAKIDFRAVGVRNKDLQNIFEKKLKDQAGEGFTISSDGLNFAIEEFKTERDGTIKVKIHADASFVPKLDTLMIKKELLFKSAKDVSSYIKTLPNTANAQVLITPRLPLFPQRIPLLTNNIELIISTKK